MNKDSYYIREEGRNLFLCCGKAGCPSVSVNEEGKVEIKDDHGNTVIMEKAEANLLPDAVKRLNEKE